MIAPTIDIDAMPLLDQAALSSALEDDLTPEAEDYAQERIADARRHIAQAQDVRDDLLAFLSADAREVLEQAGGAYIDGQLWVLTGSTDAGVPILRRIQPMRVVVGE